MADTRPQPPTRKTALAPDVRRLDERAARAWTERMAVRQLPDGRYAVESESGATYVVDLGAHTCTCPDYQIRGAVCKHLRRVAIEISTRRVPPPGKRRGLCAACGTTGFVRADADPPLCDACRLEPGDVVRDRESVRRTAADGANGDDGPVSREAGDRLVVVRVRPERADAVRVGPEGRLVADYDTNADYPADDLVVEAVYLGQYGDDDSRSYSFPISRLERVDDAVLVA